MKIIIVLAIATVLTVSAAFGQAVKAPQKDAPKLTNYPPGDGLYSVEREYILKFCKEVSEAMNNRIAGKKGISSSAFAAMTSQVTAWSNYRFIEVDTEIDISWFKSLAQFSDFFQKTLRRLESSRQPATHPDIQKLKKNLKIGAERFETLINNPPKAPEQRLTFLKREKKKFIEAEETRKKNKKSLN